MTAGEPAAPSPVQQLGASLRELLAVALDRLLGLALEKVEDLAGSLERISATGGPGIGALLGAVRAKLGGANLVWGAVKGAFGALSPGTRAAIVVVLVLALLLLPVTVVLVLLALIVLAVVLVVKTRS